MFAGDSEIDCRGTSAISVPGGRWAKRWLLTGISLVLVACTHLEPLVEPQPLGPKMATPDPLRAPRQDVPSTSGIEAGNGPPPALPRTIFRDAPGISTGSGAMIEPAARDLFTAGEPVTLSMDSVPLAAFINEVYGNILGLSFDIAPALRDNNDLVTLRVTEPTAPGNLYRLANDVLRSYGVAVRETDNLVRFETGGKSASGELPLIISGRTLPTVPASHRPVFQFVPLNAVEPRRVTNWLGTAFKGLDLQVIPANAENAVVLKGPAEVVRQALSMIDLLDRPMMSGRHSLRIEPAFLTPTALASALENVLQSEGYSVSGKAGTDAIVVIPLDTVGSVLVFSPTRQLLAHVRQWSVELDRPKSAGLETNLFHYQVRNTSASSLAGILEPIVSRVSAVVDRKIVSGDDKEESKTDISARTTSNLVVDEPRNSLVFMGSTDAWARLLPVIRDMDVPPRQVLLEVTIAEVTLDNSEQFGIEWIMSGNLGEYGVVGGTLGGLGVGSGGLALSVVNSAGATRVIMNALASRKRVNILSTPRVLVKSGSDASIEVGTDVPIITQQSTADEIVDGNTSVLQSVQYRKTGTLLRAKPVVHGDRRIEISIAQELSAAQPTTTSGINSPTILLRSVETELTLEDGGSVLLGGIISEDSTNERRSVPILGELPLIGALFRNDADATVRTELAILIVPYILDNARDAEEITQQFRNRLGEFSDPGTDRTFGDSQRGF